MASIAKCDHKFCTLKILYIIINYILIFSECNNIYLEDCIKNGKVLKVNCPMEGCKEELTEEVI